MPRFILTIIALLLALLSPASAQDWPARPVKIVVAFAAGGTADIFARLLAPELSAAFKQQFYVENKPGNSGAIGATAVARAEPDGTTLMIGGSGPHLTAPAINPNIGYDPMRDFTHIAMIGGDGYMLVANPDGGAKNFGDFVKLARERPVTIGSPGSGSLGHLILEQFRRKAGLDLQHVPFRGSGDAVTAVLGNHVASALQPVIGVGAQVRAGKLLALATTDRNPAFPGVPSFAELGLPEVRGTTWFWLAGPRNLPAPIAEALSRELRRIMQAPQIKAYFEREALLYKDLDMAALNAFLADEIATWTPLANDIGLKVQ
jgi:tripartite-type tricarboxylate transporter receptor subunit TctC